MNILNINLNLLKSFWAVYKTGGINKGAKFLGIATPVVAYNLKQLERQLDKKLFIAHKKGVDPTGDASTLYPFVENAVENLLKFNEQLERPSVGTIRIGTSTIYASFFLVKFVQDFGKRYPDIKLEFHHHPQHDYISMLEADAIDVALKQYMRRPSEQTISISELKRHDMSFYTTKKFAAEHNIADEISLEKFLELPLVLFSAKVKPLLERLENWFGRKLNVVETHTTHAAYDLVMDGQGVGYFFDEYLDSQKTDAITKIKIKDMPPAPASIYEYAYHKKPSALVSLFIKELKSFLSSS